MAIINLRKYYYPTYKTNTFIEVSDEVAEALLLMKSLSEQQAEIETELKQLENRWKVFIPHVQVFF